MAVGVRDLSCILCIILFIISNIINVTNVVNELHLVRKINFNLESYYGLNPVYIDAMWAERFNARFLQLDLSIFNALAWFSLIMPVCQAAFLLSDKGTRMMGLHISIVALVLAASLSELLSHLMNIGMNSSIRWLHHSFNLNDWGVNESGNDGVGVRVVEMLRIMGQGIVVWVDAFEWLALSGICFLMALSIKSDRKEVPTFSKYLGSLCFIITLVSFVSFASCIFKVSSFETWAPITLTTTILTTFVFLPIWLFTLSSSIPAAKARYEAAEPEAGGGEEVALPSIN